MEKLKSFKMKMRSFSVIRVFSIILTAVFVLKSPGVAFAHMFMAFPEYSSAPSGAKVQIVSTLSEPLPKPDFSAYQLGAEVLGFVVNPDGSKTDLPAFTPYDTRTGKTYTKEELDAMDPAVIHDTVDSELTRAAIKNSGGTSIIGATMKSEGRVFLAKTLVNLADDNVSVKRIGGDTVLELVPVTKIANSQLGDKAKFKLYFKGEPLPGATVAVGYKECDTPLPSDPDQTGKAEATTDASGEVELPLPKEGDPKDVDEGTDCYIFAEVEDGEISYRASLHFHLGEEEIDEADVEGTFMAPGQNKAGLTLAVEMGVEAVTWLEEMGYSWAQFLVSTPGGTSTSITGEAGQIDGKSGYSFRIPTQVSVSNLRGIIGAYAMSVPFNPQNLGQDRYDKMLKQMKAAEGGTLASETIFVPDAGFLEKNGLRLMARFSDGVTEDLSDVFQCYFFLPTSNDDAFTALVGGLFADSDPEGGKHWDKHSPEPGNILPFIFDGKADGVIEGEFWVSSVKNGISSSGGCDAGMFGSAIAGLALLVAWMNRGWNVNRKI
jgi:uncharacterized GH25 family protein